MQTDYDVIIVGAGPSGCYLAKKLDSSLRVLMVDKNSQILKKFLLSGNGRANITNTCELDKLLSNMIFGTKNFMYYAFKTHNQQEILNILDNWNLTYQPKGTSTKMHMQDDNAVFVIRMKEELSKNKNLSFLLNTKVTSCKKENKTFIVETTNGTFSTSKLVIATGGLSFSKFSGCTGDGYTFAKSFGLNVKPTFPMGISIELEKQLDQFVNLSGTSFKDVRAKLFLNKKLIIDETQDLMVTHNGLGGPIIRRVSGYLSYYQLENLDLYLSLCDKDKLLETLNKIKKLYQLWDEIPIFTKKFTHNFYNSLGLYPETDVKNLTKKIKEEIIEFFIDIKVLNILKKFNIEQAINTGGGIDTKQMDPKTFMIKNLENLYFIGEVLDVNAKTGGFNLTVCYSSASCCADDINKKCLG